MKATFSLYKILNMGILIFMFGLVSCQEEAVLEDDSNNVNNGSNFTADQLSEFLVLNNASKISQKISNAPDGKLKISFKDSIYVVKDFPYGARVAVKHDGTQEISGFYIGVADASFYYDVPIVEVESRDSTEVIYINLELPIGEEYPLTVPIKLQPHGPDGQPLDEFIRWVTIEDPDDEDVCDPTTTQKCDENGCKSPWTWFWEFTLMENYSGDIKTAYAPALYNNQNAFQHGGCCWNGISIPAKYDPYCVSGNPEYFELTVDDAYYVRYFEALDLFDNGVYERHMFHETKNYSPDSSDYCNKIAGYINNQVFAYYSGNHDFFLGADQLHLTNTTAHGNNGWMLNGGDLIYTCHSLILSFGREERWTVVYQKSADDPNDLATYFPSYYE